MSLVDPLHPSFGKFVAAVGTREHIPYMPGGRVQCFIGENNCCRTFGAGKHLAPDGVVDPSPGLPVRVQGLVHPAELRLDLVEQRAAGVGERGDVERKGVVGGDEAGGRRQVVQDRVPGAPARLPEPFPGPLRFEGFPVAFRRGPAPLRGDAGHAGAGEPVQHQIAGLGVMEDRGHDRQVRHLGVVAVRPVDGVGLAFADIDCEGLAAIGLGGVARPAVRLHERAQERVRTGGVPGRVRQAQEVVDLTVGKPGLVLPALQQVFRRIGARHALGETAKLAFVPHRPVRDGRQAGDRVVDAGEGHAGERGVQLLQTLLQLAEKMGAPRRVVLERQAQTFDRPVARGFRGLLPGLLEQPVLPRRVSEPLADPALRLATRHRFSLRRASRRLRPRGEP